MTTLAEVLRIYEIAAGGPGSGCRGPNCGRKRLDKDTLKILYRYQSQGVPGSYEDVNSYLRGEKDQEDVQSIKQVIATLDKAFEEPQRTSKEMTVYRGIGDGDLFEKFATGKWEGKVITDKAYISTTTKRNVADNFAYPHPYASSIVLSIRLPKGTPYLSTGVKEEGEMLLNRGSRFQIQSISRSGSLEEGNGRIEISCKYLRNVEASSAGEDVEAYGTSEGAEKAWDTRGRGRKQRLSERAQRAIASYNPQTKDKRAVATAMQLKVATTLRGVSTPDNDPFDVLTGRIGVEVKTLIDQDNDKITMHPESLQRKLVEARALDLKNTYTVAIDKRGGGETIYYKKGLGSFRLGSMDRLTSWNELKRVIR